MGWARANVFFEKYTRTPDPGSLMEWLFIILWNMRQHIEFHKSRSTLQALLSQKGSDEKEIMSSFKDLKEAFFPFAEKQNESELAKQRKRLFKIVNDGPMYVNPLDTSKRVRSKLKLISDEGAKKLRERSENSINIIEKARTRRRYETTSSNRSI